jgi:hypothetical protein
MNKFKYDFRFKNKMGARQGTLLEKNLAKIFELAGFKVTNRTYINGYEIDVFARWKDLSIAIECKQCEKSNISIRNLIHQWDSKNKEIGVNKVVIALFGISPNPDEIKLAQKYNISIWDEEKIGNYLDILIDDRQKGSKRLLRDLEIYDSNKNNQIFIFFKNFLSTGKNHVSKILFFLFLLLFVVLLNAIFTDPSNPNNPINVLFVLLVTGIPMYFFWKYGFKTKKR